MTESMKQAIEAIDKLHATIPYDVYCTIRNGLDEIEPLADRNVELEELWAAFCDLPMNPETECMEAPFLSFPVGTHREEVWHWFDERHSRGVHHLLYRDADGPEYYSWKELLKREAMCFECDCEACGLNDDGLCCFPLVHAKKPLITEDDGCVDSAFP